jgi:hypothetical protein
VLTPDGRYALVSSADPSFLSVIDVASRACTCISQGEQASCIGIAPDGSAALVGQYNGQAMIVI